METKTIDAMIKSLSSMCEGFGEVAFQMDATYGQKCLSCPEFLRQMCDRATRRNERLRAQALTEQDLLRLEQELNYERDVLPRGSQ